MLLRPSHHRCSLSACDQHSFQAAAAWSNHMVIPKYFSPLATDAKSQLFGKDPGAGKDWGQKEKGVTEDEMFGWYHWLNGHESEQTLGDSEGQGSLACSSSWGHRESDMTKPLNNEQQQSQKTWGWFTVIDACQTTVCDICPVSMLRDRKKNWTEFREK